MVIQNAKQGGKRYQRDIQTQIQVANKLTTPWKNEIWFKRQTLHKIQHKKINIGQHELNQKLWVI